MPSVAETPFTFRSTSPTLGKKRRREDGSTPSSEIQMKLSSSPRHTHSSIPIFHGGNSYTEERFMERERKHILPKGHRKSHDMKRQRVSLSSHYEDILFADHLIGSSLDIEGGAKILSHTQGNTSPKKKADIRPCHICHRKPTQKNELDSYTDCSGCGERTCWICFRECAEPWSEPEAELDGMILEDGSFRKEDDVIDEPWKKGKVEGHRTIICSRCCIERGTEGEVWCLGCLAGEKASRERH